MPEIHPIEITHKYEHLSPAEFKEFSEQRKRSAFVWTEAYRRESVRRGMQVAKQADCKSVT